MCGRYIPLLGIVLLACGTPTTRSGEPCTVSDQGLVRCPDGSTYQIQNGRDGLNGPVGVAGAAGESCTVAGGVITCGATVYTLPTPAKGDKGDQGIPGRDGSDAVVQIIDPCGNHSGVDEILLRMSSGDLLAWYLNVGLFKIDPGSYQTTDSSHCTFTVSSDGAVTDQLGTVWYK